MKISYWTKCAGSDLVMWLRWLVMACLLAGAASSALAAKTYSDNGDGTVTDPTTGLIWMRCSMGQTWTGSTCAGTASSYTWDQAHVLTGTVAFAGQSDWRLPNIRELQTIVDLSVYPVFDGLAFPSMPGIYFWTSSSYFPNPSDAWLVQFHDGNSNNYSKSAIFYVRLVRSGQSTGLLNLARPNSDYFDQGDGSVTHSPTGLTWQRCAVGQSWNGSTCSGTASTYTWNEAKLLTSNLAGKTDWRLPTEGELLTLVDYIKPLPAINATLAPAEPFGWSASLTLTVPDSVWRLGWNGASYPGSASGVDYVNLVRGGQSFGPAILTIDRTGAGRVTSSNRLGIACEAICSGGYNVGVSVSLVATPAANLISWGGACASAGTAATCTVTMDAAKTVTASFMDAPVISGLPPALTFATQNIGSTSIARSVTLTNSGTAALSISSIDASGEYAVTHNCGAGLGAAGSCTLNITFSPTATGTRTGSVTITSNAPGSPHSIALSGSGQGALASLSALSKSFAGQNEGTTSAAQSVILSNTGGLPLNIASIVASGDFARTNTCGATLAMAATCTISISFAPTAVGTRTGNIVITSDASNSPNTISLSGTGVAASVVSLNPTALTFAAQNSGTSSSAQTIALSNTGGAVLNLSSIAASGDFAVTNNCGVGLGPGGFCSLSVIFTPTLGGIRSGAIIIDSNAPAGPQSVSLSGTGTAFPQTVGAIIFTPNTLAVNGTTTASATATSGLAVSFSSTTLSVCTVSGSTVTGVSIGTCIIAADQAGNTNYFAAPQVTQNIAVTPASTGTLITRYRLYNDGTKEHLYTTDANEYSVLPGRGWLPEGAIYKLFQGTGSLAGVDAVPYYRLYNPLSYQHHWTTDQNEYNVLGASGWAKEGVDGYILPTAVSGSVPLYRLYLNAFGGLHLWTTDANEKNVLSTSNGWVDEGVAGWVVPLP